MSKRDVFNTDLMKQFLQLESIAPESQVVPPKLTRSHPGLLQGVRDMHWVTDRLLLAVMSDTKVTSRMDSYLVNMKLPWEKQKSGVPDVIISVGRLQMFQLSDSEELQSTWNIKFDSQAICLYFCHTSSRAVVGLDDGSVVVVQLEESTAYAAAEKVF